MFDASQYACLTELTKLIEKERDRKKFEQLIGELDALMDEEKKPVCKWPVPARVP